MKALLALLLVLAGATGVVVVGEVTRPEDRPAAQVARDPERVPVQSASAVCPDVRQLGEDLGTRVSVGAASVDGEVTDGAASLTALAAATPTTLPITGAGSALTDLGGGVNLDAVQVEATGGLAPGLEVEALTRGAVPITRGLADLRCPAPSVEQWFVGGGTRVGETAVLVLANPDPTDAIVDVTAFGASSQADEAPGRGLVVPARERLLVTLNDLAPDVASLTVHVQSRRGRVAGGVLISRVEGQVAKGLEWATAVPAPARRVVVPGLLQGPGPRQVLVANPGTEPVSVSLDLTTTDGQSSPQELAGLSVPPRRVLAVDLSGAASAGALAVTVRSSGGPVLAAGLVVDGSSSGVTDFALAAAAQPLARPAMVTDVTLAPSVDSTLLLSAVDGDATVRVTAIGVPGNQATVSGPRDLALPGGSTQALSLSDFVSPGATARLAVQVEVLTGAPVYASRFLRENGPNGPLTTTLALQPASGLVDRPQVAADPAAGRVRR